MIFTILTKTTLNNFAKIEKTTILISMLEKISTTAHYIEKLHA